MNPKNNIGYGAYLVVIEPQVPLDSLPVSVKRFEDTSSTKLELQTLIWALGEVEKLKTPMLVYTDSQNTVGLLGRRARLERNEYRSKNGRLLNNHELYKAFYELTDQMDCEFVKVSGHMQSSQKNNIDQMFTLVDKAARKALKERDTQSY